MPLTMRELLERIRPAGTPGAPTEGDRQRQRDDELTELAGVTSVLAEFASDARAIVTMAEAESLRLCEQARHRAQGIAATLPDRIASSVSVIEVQDERQHDAEERGIIAGAERESERLMKAAEVAIPAVVERAIELIWDSVLTTPDHRQ